MFQVFHNILNFFPTGKNPLGPKFQKDLKIQIIPNLFVVDVDQN